jgi:hypothetical protein
VSPFIATNCAVSIPSISASTVEPVTPTGEIFRYKDTSVLVPLLSEEDNADISISLSEDAVAAATNKVTPDPTEELGAFIERTSSFQPVQDLGLEEKSSEEKEEGDDEMKEAVLRQNKRKQSRGKQQERNSADGAAENEPKKARITRSHLSRK